MAQLLDGKRCAGHILQDLQHKIIQHHLKLRLSIILVGNNPASQTYTAMKQKRATEIGVETKVHQFPETISEEELCNFITDLNHGTDGILIQLPLPLHFNKKKILNSIQAEKDVDGLTSESLRKIVEGDEFYAPATPKGIIRLLEMYNIPLKGKDCTIINHSELIGKPLALMLLNRGATVTICHEFTSNLKEHTKTADILITAVGKPDLITADHIKDQAVVIDAGVAKKNKIIVGDVNFEETKEKASYITPVPGGIGPMTIAALLSTLVELRFKKLL